MSADFETCPVGTMARLRRVEEAAREVVAASYGDSDLSFLKALKCLVAIYGPDLEAERQADAADRMRDVMEDR